MTLTIRSEEDEQRQLKVTVEVPEEQVQTQMRKTARYVARQYHFPGFRRGKVPYNIIVGRLGEKALRADAVDEMIQPLLEEVLEEIEAEPFYQPTLDNMELQPLELQITIPLEPVVKLGDYRAIRKEVEEANITEEAVDEALEHVRNHHAVLEEVDRPAELNDLITISGEGVTGEDESTSFWHEHEAELILDANLTFKEIPFVENLVGASVGDTLNFKVAFPEDYDDEDLAGKEASFEIEVHKVQSRDVPDLDDELAKKEGEYETVEEMRLAIADELQKGARQSIRLKLLEDMVDDLLADAEINFPPAAVEMEIDGAIAELKSQVERSQMQWSDFLKLQTTTEDALREQQRESAGERVRRGLALREFVRLEKLTIEQEEIDSLLDERLERFKVDDELRDELRRIMSQGESLESLTNEVLNDKIIDRIEAVVTGNAPDLDAIDEAAADAVDEEADEEE